MTNRHELDVFGEPITEERFVPAPCISIPITEELRAKDAAERAARQPSSSDWSIKASLSETNLRKSPRAPARKAQRIRPVAKKQKPAPRKMQPAPTKIARRKHMKSTEFELLAPVSTATVPDAYFGRGRPSPYLPVFKQLQNLPTATALPIKVPEIKVGYAISAAVRKMAKVAKLKVNQRKDDAGTTFYFWLTPED